MADRRKFTVTRALTSATLFPVVEGGDRVDVPAGTKVWANWDAQPQVGLVVVRLPEDDQLWLAKRRDFERAPETFNGDQATSDRLREYWHATARAPRPYPGAEMFGVESIYGCGLDALGATASAARRTVRAAAAPAPPPAPRAATPAASPAPPSQRAAISAAAPASPTMKSGIFTSAVKSKKPGLTAAQRRAVAATGQKLKDAQNQARAAGNRAIAAGKRLARSRRGRGAAAAQKLIAAGQRLVKDASKATTIRGTGEQTTIPSDYLQQPGDQAPSVQQIASAMQQILPRVRILNAVADAGNLASELDPLIAQAAGAGLSDLAASGTDIYNRCVDVVNQANDAGVDDSVVGVVAQIKTDAAAWEAQVRQALAAPTATATTPPVDSTASTTTSDAGSFDAGSYGGGGSGGGGGEGDFGEGGDTGGDGGDEGDAAMSAEDATAAFRQSGGAFDPFAESGQPTGDEAPMDEEPAPTYDDDGGQPLSAYADDFPTVEEARAAGGADDVETPESRVIDAFRQGVDPFADRGEGVAGSVVSDTDVESTVESWFRAGRQQPTFWNAGDSPETKVIRGKPSPAAAARLAVARKRADDAKSALVALRRLEASTVAGAPASVAVRRPLLALLQLVMNAEQQLRDVRRQLQQGMLSVADFQQRVLHVFDLVVQVLSRGDKNIKKSASAVAEALLRFRQTASDVDGQAAAALLAALRQKVGQPERRLAQFLA